MTPGKQTTRGRIIEAACDLIRTEGVHAASISGIVREAHTSAGAIYHHFGNKNEIVLAVAQQAVVGPLQAILRESEPLGRSPGTLLREIVDAVMGGEVESALIVQLWAGSSGGAGLQEILRTQMASVHDGIASEIERWLVVRGAQDAASRAGTLAHITMGQAMGLLAERTILNDIDRTAYLREAAELLDSAADRL